VSVVKITPEAAEDPTVSHDERARGLVMAENLPMRVLTRLWQMLLKSLDEVAAAPNAMMAAEMAIIRLTHVADLPSPEELVRKLNNITPPPAPPQGGGGGMAPATGGGATAYASSSVMSGGGGGGATMALAVDADQVLARYPTFEHVIELIRNSNSLGSNGLAR
jgi:DNA polymerase-3 subunit gamma/tau